MKFHQASKNTTFGCDGLWRKREMVRWWRNWRRKKMRVRC